LDVDVLEQLERHPSTQLAVPYAVGDTFRGFRVVGTTEAFFDPRFPYPKAASPDAKLASGRPLRSSREALRSALDALVAPAAERAVAPPGGPGSPVNEAVVGAAVAAALDVRVGDRIEPTHGLEGGGVAHREQALWDVV